MKDTSQFTAEQIREYKILTEAEAQKRIDKFKELWELVRLRASQYVHIRPDSILIERIDYGQRGNIITRDPAKTEGRVMNSCYGLILSISPLTCSDPDKEITKNQLSAGDYINYNHNAAYSLNTLDWKTNNPELEKLYSKIWVIGIEGVLFKDLEHSKHGRFDDLAIKQVIEEQEASVEAALAKIELRKSLGEKTEDNEQTDLKTPILEGGKMMTSFRKLPTPKFHNR